MKSERQLKTENLPDDTFFASSVSAVPTQKVGVRVSFWHSWFRSHVASLTATTFDFLVTIFFTEIVRKWYVLSSGIGALSGGMVSFFLCRQWVFHCRHKHWEHQVLRYVAAVGLSMLLNISGVWMLTETFRWPYLFSKVVTATVVGITVNFAMLRYFVFR